MSQGGTINGGGGGSGRRASRHGRRNAVAVDRRSVARNRAPSLSGGGRTMSSHTPGAINCPSTAGQRGRSAHGYFTTYAEALHYAALNRKEVDDE